MKKFKITVRDNMFGELSGEFFAGTKKQAIAQALDFYAHECNTDTDALEIVSVEVAKALYFHARDDEKIIVRTERYECGNNLAVMLNTEDGELFAVLSVNIPEAAHLLGEHEFFAKTWSENETIAKDALASGIFRHTNRTCDTPLQASIWAFN